MIINQEMDNEIEGHYLKVLDVLNDSTFVVNLPANFYVTNKSKQHWMLGWPTGIPYYDAGSENLREIEAIDTTNKTVRLGRLLRGAGQPQKNQRLVFWNKTPSGFANPEPRILVKSRQWKDFAGSSVDAGVIIFDSIKKYWVMYLQEVDTNEVKIYAATSLNLQNWIPANKGNVLFAPEDFKETGWGFQGEGNGSEQTPRIYSSIFYKKQWYLFLSGNNKTGKRAIGVITTPDPIKGPFTFHKEAIVTPGTEAYDLNGCFFPKVAYNGKHFILYYDGVDANSVERLCLAESDDLITWKKFNRNPVIDEHYGWRSGLYSTEPNYVEYRGDTVLLMCGGYKKYNTEFTAEDSINNRIPLDKEIFNSSESEKGKNVSGNVMDAALGVFLSTDGGYTFKAHPNNPVWLNDYSDTLQNDHIGGNFFVITKDTSTYIIYQAKSESQRRYNILLRKK